MKKLDNKEVVSLPFIKDHIVINDKKVDGKGIAQVTQEEVDRDLKDLKKNLSDSKLLSLCSLAMEMLQVKVDKRITAAEAYRKVCDLLSSRD